MLRSALRKMEAFFLPARSRQTGDAATCSSISFPAFVLDTCASDYGGRMYNDRPAYEEAQSLLYPIIEREISPTYVFDIGANYGFTALIFASNFPKAHIFAIEPSPVLLPYLRRNLQQVPAQRVTLVDAVCGSGVREDVLFGLNPHSSQDNRVRPQAGWEAVRVRETNVDEIAKVIPSSAPVFMKIDTQGFELNVFKGAEQTLNRCAKWLVKTEFAPFCLTSQGTDPSQLLEYLTGRYEVCESPARFAFGSTTLSNLFTRPLQRHDIVPFIQYVKALNRNDTGWVDLFVRPQQLK
jgi:FkbM family methyltransferase